MSADYSGWPTREVGGTIIYFDPDLEFFLREETESSLKTQRRSAKDLIESLRVPHTEVLEIWVNGVSGGFETQVNPGDEVVVGAWMKTVDVCRESYLGRSLLEVPRFIADIHLGKTVRYLRMLGIDCYYQEPWDDELLAEISGKQQRIMLTRDVGLLKRGCIDYGIYLRSDRAIDQARQILKRVDMKPYFKEFSRCVTCNGLIFPVEKETILDLIPGGTKRTYEEFYQCRDCSKVFWRGAHYKNIGAILNEVLGG